MIGVGTGLAKSSLTFCVTGKSGLGHLRRTANIAAAIKRAAADVELRLVVNAPIDGLAREERELFAQTCVVERKDMARCVALLPEGPVVSDTAVIPDLELLPRRLILVLRETIDARLAAFRMPAGRRWDEVLVAAPREQWTVTPAAIGAARVSNVGWIYRVPPKGTARVLPAGQFLQKRILVATGGGGTPATAAALKQETEDLLAHIFRVTDDPPRILQVLGPRAPEEARLDRVDEIVDVGSRLDEAFAEADLVISTTGYNSVLELAATDTPTLLCAIPRTYDDQAARAEAWSDSLGLAHRQGEIERSARWIVETLRTGKRRPVVPLGPCGSGHTAERLLLHAGLALAPDSAFTKPTRQGTALAANAIPLRTRALFGCGVPTPPGKPTREPGSIVFAKLEGPTASQEWAALRTVDRGAEAQRRLVEQIVAPLVALHQADHEGLGLPTLDAWRRVLPRLEPDAIPVRVLGAKRLQIIRTMAARLAAIEPPATRTRSLVHGDFHLGQLIRPRGRDDFVLVDLDDLALGQPESDIGNCAAHIATSPHLHCAGIGQGVRSLLELFGTAYVTASGIRLERHRLCWHAAVALLRRVLKRAERSGDALAADETIEAAADLALDLAGNGRSAPAIETYSDTFPDTMGARP